MTAAPDSLILAEEAVQAAEDAQLALFFGGHLATDRSKPKYHCTGERLFRDRPDIYRTVVEMMADSAVSDRQIEKVCHVSHHTLQWVRVRERIPIAAHKKVIGNTLAKVARLGAERMEELVSTSTSLKDVSIATGIASERALLYNGDATVRIETVAGRNVFERFQEMFVKVSALAAEKMAAVREMGFDGENGEQKGLLVGSGADGVDLGGGDSESGAFGGASEGRTALVADSVAEVEASGTGSAGGPDLVEHGGEGVVSESEEGDTQMGNAPHDFILKEGSPA